MAVYFKQAVAYLSLPIFQEKMKQGESETHDSVFSKFWVFCLTRARGFKIKIYLDFLILNRNSDLDVDTSV